MTNSRDPRLPLLLRDNLKRQRQRFSRGLVFLILLFGIGGWTLGGMWLMVGAPCATLCVLVLVLHLAYRRDHWLAEHLLEHPQDIVAIERKRSRPETFKVRFRNGRATRLYTNGLEKKAILEYILASAPGCEIRERD